MKKITLGDKMFKILIGFLFISLFIASCSGSKGARSFASITVSIEQPPVEQGEVWGASEMQGARLIQHQFRDMLLESTGDSDHMKRDAHPKHHGCVQAKMVLDNSRLGQEHRVGLFAKNSSYNAMIRFSNGDPDHLKADKKSDVRGMAVKLYDVPYETYLEETGVEKNNSVHDFVFMNSKEFFIKDPVHYGKFMDSLKSGGLSVAMFAAGALLNPHDHFVGILRKAFAMKVGNPLDINYHSATPYKLGATSMKMMFKSCKKNKEKVPRKNAAPNFLGERLASYLDKNKTCFDFYIQPNADKKRNDIENSQDKWSTNRSPYIKVGRLEVPQQSAGSIKGRGEVCENMSFNPWRAPEEMRPLGGVNRIRLEVYVKQAKMRQNFNGVTYPGPSQFE
jgi:catalase